MFPTLSPAERLIGCGDGSGSIFQRDDDDISDMHGVCSGDGGRSGGEYLHAMPILTHDHSSTHPMCLPASLFKGATCARVIDPFCVCIGCLMMNESMNELRFEVLFNRCI